MSYRVQDHIIDVSDWEIDQNFGIFPAGARAKDAVIAPLEHGSKILTGGCRYLLKRSQQRYPDQFWGEIVAYRVGAMLGFDTPPTYVGLHRPSGVVGALVEWFYDDTTEHFVPAGDLLQVVNPDFDRKLGKAHNLTDISMLMKALARTRLKGFDWHTWLSLIHI